MNKILLLLVLTLAFIAASFALKTPAKVFSIFEAATNSCSQAYDCQKSGKSCSGDFNSLAGLSSCNISSGNSSCCAMGLFCVNSTCYADNVGKYCANVTQCFGGGDFVSCQNNTCVQLSLPGDDCSENSDCLYSSSTCSDSVCTGLGVGAKCDPSQFSCAPGLYCQTNSKGKSSCQAQLAANASCTAFDVCAGGNICASNGKCIAPFQGAANASCLFNEECGTDLYCLDKTCQTWSAWTQTECSDDSGCSNSETCLCDQITGEQFCMPKSLTVTSYCASYEQTALSCLSENNCSYYYSTQPVDSLPPNSCAAQYCKSSYKKAQGCGCSSAKDIYGDCFYSDYCSGFPVWAIVVIAIVGVIIVLVVIVVIVMVMRRRRTYDTIA